MKKKGYHQLCPVAYALDLIGARWTLLVIRELLYGPRRYKDILKGLPGIGSNLLAKRLRALENGGIINRSILPPPAGSAVYKLTEKGDALKNVMTALSIWGLTLMDSVEEEDYLGVVPTMGALSVLFDRKKVEGRQIVCEFRSSGEVFHASVHGDSIRVMPGHAGEPDIIVEVNPKTILSLFGNPDLAGAYISSGEIALRNGKRGFVREFFRRFASLEQVKRKAGSAFGAGGAGEGSAGA